jgi:hypothetical protein
MKFGTIISFIVATSFSTQAVTFSRWTFEVNTPADLSNSKMITNVASNSGNGMASGYHTSDKTDWKTPVGNGSANSLSANNWSVNDYFQFHLSTTGFTNIKVSFDQTSSGTGPELFDFAYSTDGTTFTTFATSYSVSANSSSWSTSAVNNSDAFNFDLSGITGINDVPNVFFRIIDASTNSADGGIVTGRGTDRIDNFMVAGTGKPRVSVPSAMPASFDAMILFGFLFISRRVTSAVN